jgi:chitinase
LNRLAVHLAFFMRLRPEMANHFGSPRNLRLVVLLLSGLLAASQSYCSTTQSVMLGWNPSPSTNVVGYNIYYGGMIGNYTNMVSVGNVTNATISGLVMGNTYYFAGTAVNSSGLQSALSSQTSYNVTELSNQLGISITNVISGMQVGSVAFTVKGVTTDNVAVTNVYYSLNGAPFVTATTANQWTNWSAALSLASSTNTFAAYAQDISGNVSATDRVVVVYVANNQLRFQLKGQGTISPNYSNALLQVGQKYSITATPGHGFLVPNWTISTNFAGGVETSGSTVQFVMATNLTLQANFKETARPTLTISSLSNGTHTSNAIARVIGTARDVWKVSQVLYQLNGSDWAPVMTTNGFTNWTTTLRLTAGTNIFRAFSSNLGGNYSTTNSISLISTNTFKMQFGLISRPSNASGLSFNLEISPNLNGEIQVSTNLVEWAYLTNFVGTNATTITIHDPNATNNQRFYRAMIP